MIKEKKIQIKNIIFIICLVVLAFQFRNSFLELNELIDTNEPYLQVNPTIPNQNQITLNFDSYNSGSTSYVRTDTLQIYTYKLIQTILLMFGMFMCLIFMAINNHDFSLIELAEEKKQ